MIETKEQYERIFRLDQFEGYLEIDQLRELIEALREVARTQEKLIVLYEKDASSFMALRLTHGLNSPDEDVKLGKELRTEIATIALPDWIKQDG